MRRLAILLLAVLAGASAFADPPPGYYDGANGLSGPALKTALNGIIKNGHTVISYSNLETPLRAIWEDPNNSANILLIYSDASVAKTANTWNKEHVWPRSRGNSDQSGPDDSDLHHVMPCDANVNSQRGNLYYDNSSALDGGIVSPAHPEAPECTRDSNSWQPPADQQGDIARALFYIAVRYDGTETNTTDMELVSANPSGPLMAWLSTLLAWHSSDPPDNAERARNDLIYSAYQHNRNPFIDHPEYVASIFGGGTSVPFAQVSASDPTAVESPASTGTYTVQLSAAAGPGGITVNFAMSGSAQLGEYTLSGSGVSYNSGTGAGTMFIAQGASSATVTLTATADGATESSESAVLTLASGSGYTVGGSPATINITDGPAGPPPGVIASWAFDSASYPTSLPADMGSATLSSLGWTGTINAFSGASGQAYSPTGSAGNGSFLEFSFSATGWGEVAVTFVTQRNATGSFTTGTWSASTDGVNFTTVPGNTAATSSSSFEARSVDFAGLPGLSNAPSVKLRYTLSGATNSSANNRIDNLSIRAVALPRISVATTDASASEKNADSATFTFTSDTAAAANGITLAFDLGGTTESDTDYSVSGAATFDSAAGTGTIVIPAGATNAQLTITPLADSNPAEFDETVVAQIFAGAGSTYTAGSSVSATATLHDDTPYSAEWAARFPGFTGALAATAADPDGDGVINVAECAFDLNPLVPDHSGLPQPGLRTLPDPAAGGALRSFPVITFTRRTDATAPDATPERSSNLSSWLQDCVLVESTSGANPNTEHVVFRAPQSLTNSAVFLRVRIETAP